jgi:hypothetical protein
MRVTIVAFGLMASIALASTEATAASDPYPWCAHYGANGPGTNCGFVTYAQCQATVSGNGGFCSRNLFYSGPSEGTTTQRTTKTRR